MRGTEDRSRGTFAARKEVFVRMRKITAVAAGAMAVAAIAAPSAVAGNAHFIKSASSASLSGSSLVCNFKEAGLQSGSTETISCNATEAVTYECVNGGGKNPSASNKRTFVTKASQGGQFTADKNGNLVGSLTLAPASASSLGFSCPSGQTVTVVSVCYSTVQMVDSTRGASLPM